jgi:hypothetical protein
MKAKTIIIFAVVVYLVICAVRYAGTVNNTNYTYIFSPPSSWPKALRSLIIFLLMPFATKTVRTQEAPVVGSGIIAVPQ